MGVLQMMNEAEAQRVRMANRRCNPEVPASAFCSPGALLEGATEVAAIVMRRISTSTAMLSPKMMGIKKRPGNEAITRDRHYY